MGFCILGGKENYLRKVLSDKLTSLGESISIGAAASAFSDAIQSIYTNRYADGQDSLKVSRKLTLSSSQTGSNVNIADNWYTTCDASAVYNKGKSDATIANVDGQKITVYLKIHEETHIYGGEHVGGNATLTITLPNGTRGTRSLSGDVVVTASNETLASGIVLNSMKLTCRDRSYATVEATFSVTYGGSTSKVYCKLNSDNNQSGSGSTSSWYGDGESTRYIVANGTTVYQKLAVSSSTAQML